MLTEEHLHGYQQKAVDFVVNKKRCALFLEMGLGKTVIALTAIDRLFRKKAIKRVLIIAPRKIIDLAWKPELDKWSHLELLDLDLITRNPEMGRVRDSEGLYAVSVDSVGNYVDLALWRWDMIIIDESIKIKSRSTNRFRGVKRLTSHPSTRVVIMTGIPAPNTEIDLWAQYFVVDRGERLGKTKGGFLERYFRSIMVGFGRKVQLKRGCDEKIVNQLKDITMSLKSEDWLDLPEKQVIDYSLELDKGLKSDYNRLESNLIYSLQGEDMEITSATAALNKALQFCNGFLYDNEKNAVHIHDMKLDYLEQLLESSAGENALVCYYYKADLERLKKRFPYAEEVSKKNIERWNQGKIKLLLLHPQSSGYGLNLQFGGSIIIWYSLVWSYSDYNQTNARLWRQGQENHVRIMRLIVKDTVEERVARALETKHETNENIMQALKRQLT